MWDSAIIGGDMHPFSSVFFLLTSYITDQHSCKSDLAGSKLAEGGEVNISKGLFISYVLYSMSITTTEEPVQSASATLSPIEHRHAGEIRLPTQLSRWVSPALKNSI